MKCQLGLSLCSMAVTNEQNARNVIGTTLKMYQQHLRFTRRSRIHPLCHRHVFHKVEHLLTFLFRSLSCAKQSKKSCLCSDQDKKIATTLLQSLSCRNKENQNTVTVATSILILPSSLTTASVQPSFQAVVEESQNKKQGYSPRHFGGLFLRSWQHRYAYSCIFFIVVCIYVHI